MLAKIKDVAGVLKHMKGQKSFDRVLEKVTITSVGDGICTAELKLEDEHVNEIGILHNGLSTTIVDCISGYALMTKIPGAHVSVDIHMNFVKKASVGEHILIDSCVNRMGKTMAYLGVEIRSKDSGDLIVIGKHTKYILN